MIVVPLIGILTSKVSFSSMWKTPAWYVVLPLQAQLLITILLRMKVV